MSARVWLAVLLAMAAAAACVELPFAGRPCPSDGRCPDGLRCVLNADGDGGVCRADAAGGGAGGGGGAADAGGGAGGGGGDDRDGGCPQLCGDNEDCVAGACVRRDCANVTCDRGLVCANGGCLPTECGGAPCALGAVCDRGRCVALSCAFVGCPPNQVCIGGGLCAPTACSSRPCGPNRVCINETCQDLSCIGLRCDVDAGFDAGLKCAGGQCLSCAGAATETACDDASDDDCDGLVDCLDPDCFDQACNDQKSCTANERCQADGGCGGGVPVACGAPTQQCRAGAGSCNQQTGQCEWPLADAGAPCEDGNPCTLDDRCNATGACVGGGIKSCPALTCKSNLCNPADGGCVATPTPGAPCQDGTMCTANDTCTDAGTCVGVDTNPCHFGAGIDPQCEQYASCDPLTGTCVLQEPATCFNVNECHVARCVLGGSGPRCLTTDYRPDGYRLTTSEVCCGHEPTQLTSRLSCGGCGAVCAGNLSCNVVSGCPGPSTTGACACQTQRDCPFGQSCVNGQCAPGMPAQCAMSAMPVMCASAMACNYP
ncbi:MAG: hypothetical protein AB1730_07330 [Myxococcota bacterium]